MHVHELGIVLGFGDLGGFLPDKAGGLRVQQLVPQAAADQVGPLRQVEHGPLCRHCDATSLQPHTDYKSCLTVCMKQLCLSAHPAVRILHAQHAQMLAKTTPRLVSDAYAYCLVCLPCMMHKARTSYLLQQHKGIKRRTMQGVG